MTLNKWHKAIVLILVAFLLGSFCWHCIGRSVSDWYNSYEVWIYYHDDGFSKAEEHNGRVEIIVKGGSSWSDHHIFACSVSTEYYRKAAAININGPVTLPSELCREILP